MIRYENEHTGLDFKKTQYTKGESEEFLRDLIAIANTEIDAERYIIIGVKEQPDGTRKFHPIPREKFVDQATYQQLVQENVEPDVPVTYEPFELDGQLLGAFRVGPCPDVPYMMRKDFRDLRKGDSWVRKGSRKDRLTRRDLDRLLAWKGKTGAFGGNVFVGFGDPHETSIELTALTDYKLPSKRAREQIEEQLASRKAEGKSVHRSKAEGLHPIFDVLSVKPKSLLHRTDEELQQALKDLESSYVSEDQYDLMEVHSHKLNLTLLNDSDRYLEDVEVELEIPKDTLLVATEKPKKPQRPTWPIDVSGVRESLYDFDVVDYPEVKQGPDAFLIRKHFQELRHKRPTAAFTEPVRIVLGPPLVGMQLNLTWRLFARNLPNPPITGSLTINVVSAAEEGSRV